jgi:hypothetical protein
MNSLVINCIESLKFVLKNYNITNYDINHEKENSPCLILKRNGILVYDVKNGKAHNYRIHQNIKNACFDILNRVAKNKDWAHDMRRDFVNKIKDNGMIKNKYMEDLGIEKRHYGTNFCSDDDKRSPDWAFEKTLFGFDQRETWNLNYTFIEWLYTRLMMFCEVNIIDTSYHKIEWQGKELTMQECIDILINVSKEFLLDTDDDNKFLAVCDLMPLWGKLLPYMWW